MKELMPQAIIVEQMNGFRPVVEEMRSKFGRELIYGELNEFTDGDKAYNEVIGLVKGPRTKLSSDMLARIGGIMQDPIIAYIGRHPRLILDDEVLYNKRRFHDREVLFIQTKNKEIPLLSIEQSPLSYAVAHYVLDIASSILEGRRNGITKLTIQGGNTFDKRMGHGFNENYDGVADVFRDYNIGVIGAGDIGSKVARAFSKRGSKVYYTAETQKEHHEVSAEFVPTIEELLQCAGAPSIPSILTIHLPKGVKVPLRHVSNVNVLINTSHGSNIDEGELIEALDEGRIKHAVLDVFKFEGKDFDKNKLSSLIKDKRLTLTPHIAYNEPTAIRQTLEMAMQNLMLYRNSKQNI